MAPTMRRPQAPGPKQMQPQQGTIVPPNDPDGSGFVSLPSGVADVPVLASGAMAPLPAAGGTKFGDDTPRSRQKGNMADQFSGLFGKRAMQVPPQKDDMMPMPVPQQQGMMSGMQQPMQPMPQPMQSSAAPKPAGIM